jgi:hypothetical protein
MLAPLSDGRLVSFGWSMPRIWNINNGTYKHLEEAIFSPITAMVQLSDERFALCSEQKEFRIEIRNINGTLERTFPDAHSRGIRCVI